MADPVLTQTLSGVVKVVLNLRLVSLLLTLAWLPLVEPEDLRPITWLVLALSVTSLVPILGWHRIGSWVLEHPAAMLLDVVAAIAVLGLVGLDTPFGLYVVTTALVAGVLYGWTGTWVMSAALLLAYVAAAIARQQVPTLVEVLGTPALIPGLAAVGAGVRVLLVRQHETATALAESSMTTAAAVERARLAREMHDTLAKTLHGIALSAAAVPRLLQHDQHAAGVTAAGLAQTATRAADEARALIVDLRTDDLERPLGASLREMLETWSARTGVAVTADVHDCCGLSPSARYELFCIAQEALRNAHEHGGAQRVEVLLHDGDEVVLRVVDDGAGFDPPDDLAELTRDGHFGLVGMSERAAVAGGRFAVSGQRGHGTTVTATVPRTVPSDAALSSPVELSSEPREVRP